MTPYSTIRAAALGALFCTLLAGCAGKQVVVPQAPLPPVTSVAQADQQLAAVARERAVIEARFSDREQVCYHKFFATNCLNDAKEERRTALSAQRAIEIQAQRFKRTVVVEERDRQVAEAERRFAEQEARMAAEPPKPAPTVKPEPAARTSTVPARVASRRPARRPTSSANSRMPASAPPACRPTRHARPRPSGARRRSPNARRNVRRRKRKTRPRRSSRRPSESIWLDQA
jgi:colicin import membrane protein